MTWARNPHETWSRPKSHLDPGHLIGSWSDVIHGENPERHACFGKQKQNKETIWETLRNYMNFRLGHYIYYSCSTTLRDFFRILWLQRLKQTKITSPLLATKILASKEDIFLVFSTVQIPQKRRSPRKVWFPLPENSYQSGLFPNIAFKVGGKSDPTRY